MKSSRVVAIVVGALLLLPGLGMVVGGSALTLAYAFGRDDGYFEVSLDRIQTTTVAVTAEDLDLAADPGSPDWLLDAFDVDIRLQVVPVDADAALFVGIGPEADVDAYLAGAAHDEIDEMDGLAPQYRRRAGGEEIDPPALQDFWTASSSGAGDQELLWEAQSGNWAVVVMNADGAPGVAADVRVGAKAGFVLPLALTLLGLGAVIVAGSVALIVTATSRHRAETLEQEPPPPAGAVPLAEAPVDDEVVTAEAMALSASLDPDLSAWKWLVKWFLAIPHFIVLAFLWVAFAVTTLVAGFAILFTGNYPRALFDFNVGVLRWTWRVSFYAGPGGLGTDVYPPFTLDDDPAYPARLHVAHPGELSRGLVLVKWWLLAIPHYLVIAAMTGGWLGDRGGEGTGISLLGVLVLIAAVILLFTGRYRRSLFDLIVGLNRWIFRVVAYGALMTDRYPPFRLDQGGEEPT